MDQIPFYTGVAPLADRYDGFLLDLWGVLHDGVTAYPGVIECLERLHQARKVVGLLSNAPRRVASVAARLEELGIAPGHYDFLMTSGEATREALEAPPDHWHANLGPALYHIGPERDRCLFEDLPDRRAVARLEDADFVLNTGPRLYEETLADYEDELRACADRRLPMVCANPDLIVMVGEAMVVCAGLLARRYEELGGDVRYHGKPHPAVYRRCLALTGISDRRRLLAIGDSLRTDIAGAVAAALDAALVPGGIHAEELGIPWGGEPDPARLEALVNQGPRPRLALACLQW